MKYKMIVLDLDDTLLNSNHEISQGNLEALQKADKIGIKIILCSGRPTAGIRKYYYQIFQDPVNQHLISFNGASISEVKSGREIFKKGLPADIAKEIVITARKHNIIAQTYDGDKFYVEKANERAEMYQKSTVLEYDAVGRLEDFITVDPHKILYNSPHENLEKVYPDLKQRSKGRYHVVYSKPFYLEFINAEVNKGSAILHLCNLLNINREEVIAAGDSYNDIEMIQTAGLGIAVKNAKEEVKTAADFVTTAVAEDDAVKEIIEQFLL